MSSPLNPQTNHFEFLGPPGAFLISLAVPAISYALYYGCSEFSQGCPPAISTDLLRKSLSDPNTWKRLWDTDATLIYFAWYAFCVSAWLLLPGDWVQGVKLRNGNKIKYKINAFSTFLLALGLSLGYIQRFGPKSFTFFYDKYVGFVTASILMAVLQAVACYASSFRKGRLLALGGNSGNHIYDFYIGRELNPSVGSFDIKSFNELRPGLILWVLVNMSMICKQAVRRGGLQHVTDSMWLVFAFQAWYVADALYNEPAILTTMDITTDGFGFMLAIGDLTWVPFVYSLQARFLAFNPIKLGPLYTSLIFAANALGYYIFRSANSEKDEFRKGNNPKNLKYISTKNGSKLLVEGWWGWSRHPNYFGDILMALAWSLPTGFSTPITYFYVIYFVVLLIHRQRRDDENCHKKYGSDWERYIKIVKYRIVRYVY